MTDQRSIKAELQALQEARKHDDPRIVAMVADVKQIRLEAKGQSQCCNLALGNSRETLTAVLELERVVSAQRDEITNLKTAVEKLQADLAAAIERIENMAQWAKTKGKT